LRQLYAAVAKLDSDTHLSIVASDIFWILATLDVVVSVVFMVRVQSVVASSPARQTRLFAIAQGQQKDSWLACAIVWVVLLSDGCPVRNYLFVGGALIIAWLLQRTLQRYRLFEGIQRSA
jgi:cobalamin synthase